MHELELKKQKTIKEKLDFSLQECVSGKMSKMYHEGEDKKLTREQMLGKAYGICRE